MAAYDLEAVRRRWEGHATPLAWGRYPVERDPIRRYCHMVDDANPRYLDGDECPPVMVDYFASAGAWPPAEQDLLSLVRAIPTPGDRLVNLGHEFEWLRTVRVGERLGARHRVASIEVRPTRLDPLSVWIRTETSIVAGAEEVVARRLNQIMVHRTAEEVATDRSQPERRAPEALRGDPAPSGAETLSGFTLALTPTRMVLQVSGTQDFYPIHHDRDFARAGGHADIFVNTGFIRAALCRLVTDWMGADGFLARLGFTMRRPHLLGDTIAVRGRVRHRRSDGPHTAADLDVWIENPRDGVATPGTATVRLPRRA